MNLCEDCIFWQIAAPDNNTSKTAICPIIKGRKHRKARACDAFQPPAAEHECQCCDSEYCSCLDCSKAGKDTCGKEESE